MNIHKILERYAESEIISSTRTLSVLSALLYLCFSVADIWAIESSLDEALFTRGIVVSFLLFSYLSTYSSFFYRFCNIIISLDILIAAMGIIYMIYLASPNDHAYHVYFVGLVLILMTLFSWTYTKLSSAIFITVLILSGYLYVEVSTRSADETLALSKLITNLFFIVSAVVIGFIARLMRDRFMHENFMLQESLSEALEEKIVEAKDNARLANHDELTGLPNRRYAIELLEDSLSIAKQKNKVLVVMFVDLNGFKQINDVYGHATGDEVLKIVARRLELAVRKSDCLSRLGGDEYLIGLLIDKENVSEIENMAEKFSSIISDPMNVDGVRLQVGASVGISAYPYHGNQVNVLMDIADKKMYQVKKGNADSDNSEFIDRDDDSSIVIFPGKTKH